MFVGRGCGRVLEMGLWVGVKHVTWWAHLAIACRSSFHARLGCDNIEIYLGDGFTIGEFLFDVAICDYCW